jgi:hypothetical protein
MKKIIIAILITILVMLQIFYYLLINAKATFGYNTSGGQVVSIDIGVQQFNYWEVE